MRDCERLSTEVFSEVSHCDSAHINYVNDRQQWSNLTSLVMVESERR